MTARQEGRKPARSERPLKVLRIAGPGMKLQERMKIIELLSEEEKNAQLDSKIDEQGPRLGESIRHEASHICFLLRFLKLD